MKREARRTIHPELEQVPAEGTLRGPGLADIIDEEASAAKTAEVVEAVAEEAEEPMSAPAAPENPEDALAEMVAARMTSEASAEPKQRPIREMHRENVQGFSISHGIQRIKRAFRPATKRQKSNKKALDNLISTRLVIIFAGFALLIALFLLIIPRSTFSQVERRSLSTWPEFSIDNYFSGKYTSGITQVYDDTVPARDSFKNAGNNIKSMFGIRSSGSGEIIGNATRVQDKTKNTEPETEPQTPVADVAEVSDDAAAAPEETETTTPEDTINSKDYHVENNNAFIEDGIVVVFQDDHWRAITLFGGIYDTIYSSTVNYMHSVLGDDVHLWFMPIPTACQFYLPSNYQDYSVDQTETFDQLSAEMADGVTSINIIDVENNHNEEDIYLRTDHHWAPLGAYYGAREFARIAGVPFADLSTYTKKVNPGYVGTMYAYTESANILNDPEDFVYYEPANEYITDYYDTAFNYLYRSSLFVDQSDYVGNSYSTFMGTDAVIVKITTDNKNGRKLLVVKDSFGNALIPFLTGSFEQVFVTDQRYFDINFINFIRYNGITDVLFAHSFYSLGNAPAEMLQDIVYYNGEVAFYDGAPEAILPGEKGAEDTADTAEQTVEQDAVDTSVDVEDAAADTYDVGYTDDYAAYEGYDTGYGYDTTDYGYDTGYYGDDTYF